MVIKPGFVGVYSWVRCTCPQGGWGKRAHTGLRHPGILAQLNALLGPLAPADHLGGFCADLGPSHWDTLLPFVSTRWRHAPTYNTTVSNWKASFSQRWLAGYSIGQGSLPWTPVPFPIEHLLCARCFSQIG